MEKKVILITGASSGIGMSAASMLLKKGHIVYAAARRTERMADLQQAGAHILPMDVTDDASMDEGVKHILNAEGRIDVVVNNAGYGFFGALENVPIEEARRQFEVNVFGLARLTQLVLPSMRAQHSGRIVNVASMAGHFCEPHGAWYHATKYAVVALSDCLRMEAKPFGIEVSLIEPGAIASEWCDIAMNHLEASSEGTVYEAGARQHSKLFRWAYSHFASPADRVGKAIAHAATTRRPRIRYRKGFGASLFVLMHDIMPTRWFDAMARRMFGC